MLFVAIVILVLGVVLDVSWMKTVAWWLTFPGILSGVAGAAMVGMAPTGYSSLDFGAPGFDPATGLPMMGSIDVAGNAFGSDGFDFNPANGMPMIGGMGGVDVFGNSFGTDMNDPW